MLLTRRQVFAATGVVGASMVIGSGQAVAGPKGWETWLAGNRDHVGAVLDDGRGGRLDHRAQQERILGPAVTAVHAAGYALAVEQGRVKPDELVRVGDWEAYHLGLDGGAHQAALTDLGIPFANGRTADDPDRLVALDDLVKAAVLHGDDAAADFVRTRVGDATLRAAAVRSGWPAADVRSLGGEALMLVLPGRAPANPAGRKQVGDALMAQALHDPRLKLEIIGRSPNIPATSHGRPAQPAPLDRGREVPRRASPLGTRVHGRAASRCAGDRGQGRLAARRTGGRLRRALGGRADRHRRGARRGGRRAAVHSGR